MESLVLTFVGVGLLGIALSLPLLYGKIKRNYWYGFRFPSAFRSEEAWQEVNRYGAKGLLWTSVALLLAALLLYFVPGISMDTYSLVCGLIFAVGITITVVQTVRYNQTLK